MPPPGNAGDFLGLLAEEEEARRDHGDVPLPGGLSIINGIICADDSSARRITQMVREDLGEPLDPDRRS